MEMSSKPGGIAQMVRKNKALIIAVLFALVLPIFTACAQGEGKMDAGAIVLLVRHEEGLS